METFEPGIKSPYSTHTFRVGEQGMKCLNCPRVMTMDEWEEKRRCFCRSINAISAVARSTPPTRLETNVRPQNRRNTISNSSPVTSTTSTSSPRSTSSSGSDRSRYTSPLSSNSTNSSNSSGSRNFPFDIRGCATALALFLGLGWCTAQFAQSSRNQTQQTASTQNLQPKLTPQQVVTKYYQLATSNREGAKALLSDAFKNSWKEKNPGNDDKSSLSEYIKIDAYSFKPNTQSSTNSKLEVLLRYTRKNNEILCESQIMELVLDQSKGLWLIDNVPQDGIKYNIDCPP